jgi:hypothetical protein
MMDTAKFFALAKAIKGHGDCRCAPCRVFMGASKERYAAMSNWLNQAHKAVESAYPNVDWTVDNNETRAADRKLDFYLGAHFLKDGGIGNVNINAVRDAWRVYYRLHIPEGAA